MNTDRIIEAARGLSEHFAFQPTEDAQDHLRYLPLFVHLARGAKGIKSSEDPVGLYEHLQSQRRQVDPLICPSCRTMCEKLELTDFIPA